MTMTEYRIERRTPKAGERYLTEDGTQIARAGGDYPTGAIRNVLVPVHPIWPTADVIRTPQGPPVTRYAVETTPPEDMTVGDQYRDHGRTYTIDRIVANTPYGTAPDCRAWWIRDDTGHPALVDADRTVDRIISWTADTLDDLTNLPDCTILSIDGTITAHHQHPDDPDTHTFTQTGDTNYYGAEVVGLPAIIIPTDWTRRDHQ